ncbi:MAG: helix-turn-helix domain-containing protein [Candidatus Gracilibacteria bacterium]|jgi:sugar-specific transcriptional regulator TrmB
MQDLISFLKDQGLSEKEAQLYLAALRYGPQPSSFLAGKTGLPRSTVDYVFQELVQKGFGASHKENEIRYYSAINPEHIEFFLLDKLGEAKKQMESFKDLVPLFKQQMNMWSSLPLVQYFQGVKGLERMLDDFSSVDQTVLYISGHNMMHPKIREYTYDVYLPAVRKHKNKNKIIMNDGEKAREYQKKASEAYDEFIFVDPVKFPLTLTTAIYGDKVAFWSYDPSDMSGVILKNSMMASQMRTIFEALRQFFSQSSR